jgi:hypothetical protein
MQIGFTGTRHGMKRNQFATFMSEMTKVLQREKRFKPRFHHGDCVGADAQAHSFVRKYTHVHIHPSNIDGCRAFCDGDDFWGPKAPLLRNRDIVDACSILFATPKHNYEEIRSGTWATIRYARKVGRHIIIIFPDGSIKEENK